MRSHRPAAAGTGPSGLAEYNPVRSEPVSLGPQANRLLVGFRVTAANAVTETVTSRLRAQRRTVTLANTSAADAAGAAGRAGLAIVRSRQITPSMHVLFLPKTLYGTAVEAALAKLRADPAVQFAVVDRRRYPLAVTPDDPLFVPNSSSGGPANGQWYMNTPSSTVITLEGNATTDLSATDAVSAWGITTGSDGIVIADVDTGVRFDHPDLLRAGFGGRLLPGYDFVGEDYDPTNGTALGTFLIANDGDGWDPDPSDPGDWVSAADLQNALFANDPVASSSWHGTRVVGVMGALTDNGVGIAGMSWGAWILPVRSLGKGGGYDSDIIAGIEWAAGLSVVNPDGPPVPQNPYAADIVNLSLGGGTDACTSSDGAAYETALQTVTALGVLVVISAGNSNGPVELPGNCSTVVPGVMAVAGLRNVGTKVGYSSFGSQVSISAPAGNCVTTSGDCLRSIDTTTNLGTTAPGDDSYTNEIDSNLGTSFSAPIVSGIAALMKSVNNNLTPAQIIVRMQAAASPFPAGAAGVPTCPATASGGECACPNDGSQCGAGMVDALAAVEAAQKPIAVIALPAAVGAGSVIDAGASVAGCNTSARDARPACHRFLRLVGRALESHRERGGGFQGHHRSVAGNAHAHRHGQRGAHRYRDRDPDGEHCDHHGAVDLRRPEERLSHGARGVAAAADGDGEFLSGDGRREHGIDADRDARQRQRLRPHSIEPRADSALGAHARPDARPVDLLHGRRPLAHEYLDDRFLERGEHRGGRQLHHYAARAERGRRHLRGRDRGAGARHRSRRRQHASGRREPDGERTERRGRRCVRCRGI